MEYISVREASRITGVCESSINRVCRYQQKTAGGMVWRYKFHDNPNHTVMPTYNSLNKGVWCYEDKKFFESIADAARYYELDPSGITKCCRGKLKSSGGKHFYYDGDKPSLDQPTYGAKPCECIDTGEWFPSVSEASRQTGVGQTSIAKVCGNSQKTAGGKRWRYLNLEETQFYFENYIIDWSGAAKKNKKVRCKETNVIYDTAIIAGQKLSISVQQIRKACLNNCTAGGYHWEYVEE